MRAPEFWRTGGWPARALAPAAALYEAAAARRAARRTPAPAPAPTVCVGNLVAGGAGKTPTAIAIACRLRARGRAPHLLARGYGGRARGPLRVDPARHDARAVGDEALLLARAAPVWVARRRAEAAAAARAAGAGALVLDDGFQSRELAADIALVVVDGGYGFGNGRLLPAGPLRERVERGLARASAVVLVGEDRTGARRRLPAGLPVLSARLAPGRGREAVAGKRVVAFAGIGRPGKFFETLEGLGCAVAAAHEFADHRRYRAHEILALADKAAALDAVLVTTAKDAARIPEPLRALPAVLEVTLEWTAAAAAALDALLARLPP